MKHLRALGRLIGVAVFTACMYVAYLATRVSRLFTADAALRSHAWCFRTWARGVARIISMRVAVRGPAPRPPCFLVSNHLSYIDVIALGTTADWTFVAKSEVAGWPVIGFLARAVNVIFVDRERRGDLPRVLERMRHVLAAGYGVTFFPEGTSSPGRTVLPFKPSLFEAPIETGYPVRCASVSYKTPADEPPAHRAVCWYGDMTFPDHFYRLLELSRFDATVVYAPDPVHGADRKELAAAAHGKVAETFTPVVASEP